MLNHIEWTRMKSQIATIRSNDPSTNEAPRFEALNSVQWDFPDRTRQSDLEAIHPYPAKFIPELPGAVLDRLALPKGTIVLDPFVGSGTTLVECQKRGIESVGIDLKTLRGASPQSSSNSSSSLTPALGLRLCGALRPPSDPVTNGSREEA